MALPRQTARARETTFMHAAPGPTRDRPPPGRARQTRVPGGSAAVRPTNLGAPALGLLPHPHVGLRRAEERFELNLPDIAEVWRRGSVISSWLLDLTAQALAGDPQLDQFTGAVADSGEGRWTLEAALEESVPADVLAAALFARFRSRGTQVFGDKLLSAMRFAFGGHVEEVGKGQL